MNIRQAAKIIKADGRTFWNRARQSPRRLRKGVSDHPPWRPQTYYAAARKARSYMERRDNREQRIVETA